EHRAFWGEDKIPGGQVGTASKRHLGPLPKPGQWVRLEVPSAEVALDGRVLRGISFTEFGGHAQWREAGTLPGGEREVTQLIAVGKYPLKPAVIESAHRVASDAAVAAEAGAGKAS